jgi:uncharacterized protein (TIGR02231 family)
VSEHRLKDVPVAEVTLLEDRAQVLRRARVTLTAGVTKLRIIGVAPVLSDKTLVARLDGAQSDAKGARVVDARVKRQLVARTAEDDDDAYAALQKRLHELDEQNDSLDAERRALERHADALDELTKLALRELADDVTWGKAPGESARDELEQLSNQRRNERSRVMELRTTVARGRERRQRLADRVDAMETPAHKALATIEIELLADADGEHLLTVDYVVPNACWRPYHTARLTHGDNGALVHFVSDACVWQNTGEDWTKVRLSFSTQRASLGIEPPELETDELAVRRRRETVQVEKRERSIEAVTAGEPRTIDELPGIDDGGDEVTLVASNDADVPSDGRPHRIAIGGFDAEVALELISYPELTPCVLTKVSLKNEGDRPVLAGPVDLIREGGICGRTSVLYIGRGEPFDIGFGPDAELRVSREVDVEQEDAGMLSSWVKLDHHVQVRLSNMGPDPRTVHVRERIPVSEIEKVKIASDAKRTTSRRKPDADGFLDWQVELNAFDTATIELRYRIEKHTDVVGL